MLSIFRILRTLSLVLVLSPAGMAVAEETGIPLATPTPGGEGQACTCVKGLDQIVSSDCGDANVRFCGQWGCVLNTTNVGLGECAAGGSGFYCGCVIGEQFKPAVDPADCTYLGGTVIRRVTETDLVLGVQGTIYKGCSVIPLPSDTSPPGGIL
jgi:hypothetical protein